jgi:hypothetical protein
VATGVIQMSRTTTTTTMYNYTRQNAIFADVVELTRTELLTESSVEE